MIFSTPFIPFQTELISMFTKADEMNFSVFDACMTVDEIIDSLKNMDNIHYGVISDVSCTPSSAKTDSIMWRCNVRIELFSTYTGRKQVAEMVNTIGNVATKYQKVFGTRLQAGGYSLVRLEIGESVIGSAIFANGITWQNGYINLVYHLYQLDS